MRWLVEGSNHTHDEQLVTLRKLDVEPTMHWLSLYLSREQHVATNGTSSAVSPSWVSSMDYEWCVVFLIGAALQMLGGGVYLALASDQVQPWVPKRRLAGAARSA